MPGRQAVRSGPEGAKGNGSICMRGLVHALLAAVLLASVGTAASNPGDAVDDADHGRASALRVSMIETSDAVRLLILTTEGVEAESVEIRFAGRKMVVRARDLQGRPIRSQSLRLPWPVVEQGASAEYDSDGALVMTFRKLASGARHTDELDAVIR